jgi:hypothetical protein
MLKLHCHRIYTLWTWRVVERRLHLYSDTEFGTITVCTEWCCCLEADLVKALTALVTQAYLLLSFIAAIFLSYLELLPTKLFATSVVPWITHLEKVRNILHRYSPCSFTCSVRWHMWGILLNKLDIVILLSVVSLQRCPHNLWLSLYIHSLFNPCQIWKFYINFLLSVNGTQLSWMTLIILRTVNVYFTA